MTPPEGTAAPAAAAAPDVTALQRQIDELKEQNAEHQRTAEFWAAKARVVTPAPAAVATDDDDTDVLEALTTGGTKGFDALAEKRGFMKRDQVEELINTRATSLTKEQELIQEFPDLKKKDSEFFKSTALTYGNLVKNGVPQPIAMEQAARMTELDFLRSGKIKLPGAEPTKEEKETARLARVAAQSGPGTGKRPAAGDEDDDDLTPEQKHIADQMGITHEAYSKRAKAGVSIKGR